MASDLIDITVTRLRDGDSITINNTDADKSIVINVVADSGSRATQTAIDTSNVVPSSDEAEVAIERLAEALSESTFVNSTTINGTVISIQLVDSSDFNVNSTVTYVTTNGSLFRTVRVINQDGAVQEFDDPYVPNITITSITHEPVDLGYTAKNAPYGNTGSPILTTINFTVADTFNNLEYKFGWDKNSNSIYTGSDYKIDDSKFESKYDGNIQAYNGTTGTLNPLSPISWVTGEASLILVSGNDYRIEHTHLLPILTRPDDVNSDNSITIPEELRGSESLRYLLEINLQTDLADINASETTSLQDLTNFLGAGNIGYVDQVYKTGLSYYSLESFEYTNEDNEINYGLDTTGQAIISTTGTAFSTTSEIAINIQRIDDSLSNDESLNDQLKIDRVLVNMDGSTSNGTVLTGVSASVVSSECVIDFTVAAGNIDSDYRIWFEVNNGTTTNNNHNVNGIVSTAITAADTSVIDFATYGSTTYDEFLINFHYDDTDTNAFNQVRSFVENINLARWRILNSDTTNTTVNQFTISIRSRTNSTILEQITISADNIPFTQERVFTLSSNSIRNTIEVSQNAVGDWNFTYPFQIWQGWESVDNVVLSCSANCTQVLDTGDEVEFDKEWQTPDFELGTYDETKNGVTQPQALRTSYSMQLYDVDSGNEVSVIQKDKKTLIRATWEDNNLNDLDSGISTFPTVMTTTNTGVGNLVAYFGITTDAINQSDYLRFHNFRENPTGTLWSEPTGGETNYAELTILDIKTAQLEAVVDPDLITERFGSDFNCLYLSARLDKYQSNTGEAVDICIVFNTTFDVPNDGTFEPSTTWDASFTRTWKLSQGSEISTDSLSIADRTGLLTGELDGTNQEVQLCVGSTQSFSDLLTIDLSDSEVVGDLDVSLLTGATSFMFVDNDITSITLPTNSEEITVFNIQQNPNLTELDLSPMTGIGGTVFFPNCAIDTLTFPTSSNEITILSGDSNNIQTVDLTGLTYSGTVSFQNNDLTTVIMPTPENVVSTLNLAGNSNLTTLDLSNLNPSLLEGDMRFTSCNLSSITFPATMGTITLMTLLDNNFSGNWTELSGLGNALAGQIYIDQNNFTSVSLPTSTSTLTVFSCSLCSLLTSLDLSTLSGLSGQLNLASNTSMTSVTLPTTYSSNITFINISNCTNLSTINLSALNNNWQGIFRAFNGNSLGTITLPVCTNVITTIALSNSSYTAIDLSQISGTAIGNNSDIQCQNNLLPTSELDDILSHLDSEGWTNGTLDISNNSGTPTGGASNTNKLSLEGKGWTVTI